MWLSSDRVKKQLSKMKDAILKTFLLENYITVKQVTGAEIPNNAL